MMFPEVVDKGRGGETGVLRLGKADVRLVRIDVDGMPFCSWNANRQSLLKLIFLVVGSDDQQLFSFLSKEKPVYPFFRVQDLGNPLMPAGIIAVRMNEIFLGIDNEYAFRQI